MLIGGLQKTSLIDFPKKIAAIVFTHGCNFRCPYCHNPELVYSGREALDENYVFDFLKTRKGKLNGVVVTGGEPCLQKDLVDFLKEIKNFGFDIKLDTNGSEFNMLDKIIGENLVNYVAMDIKAPLEKYESVVGTNVNIQNIEKSINLIMTSGVEYEFRTTVTRELLTVDDFFDIGQLIKGANKYFLQKFLFSKVLDESFKTASSFDDAEFNECIQILKSYEIKEVSVR